MLSVCCKFYTLKEYFKNNKNGISFKKRLRLTEKNTYHTQVSSRTNTMYLILYNILDTCLIGFEKKNWKQHIIVKN